MAERVANPFSKVMLLVLILIGCLAFFGMLYGLGAGDSLVKRSDGQSHAASKSLIGYHALTRLLKAEGYAVDLSRRPETDGAMTLLVITPDLNSDWAEVQQLISGHRYNGPTLVILPKWLAFPDKEIGRGWVRLVDAFPVNTEIDGVKIATKATTKGSASGALQSPFGVAPKTPERLTTMDAEGLYPLLRAGSSDRAVIAYLDDDYYEWLERLGDPATTPEPSTATETYDMEPVIFVADPDLFNNKGLADQQTALHALNVINAINDGVGYRIVFDLTANGMGKSDNLLTLAFRPPFLAATICFLVAAFMVGWMAFTRFAPPLLAARVIDFGKETLVRNSAATMRMLQREHLLREPYVKLIERMAARRLNLAPGADDAVIHARLDARTPDDVMPYSARRNQLLASKTPEDIAAASAELHAWKKEYL